MSNNKLKTVARRDAKPPKDNHKNVWDTIITLDISQNRIEKVDPSLLPRSLKHLKINYNKLSEFSNEEISYFEGLHERNNETGISLGNNPFKCECESKLFFGFVKR